MYVIRSHNNNTNHTNNTNNTNALTLLGGLNLGGGDQLQPEHIAFVTHIKGAVLVDHATDLCVEWYEV